MTTKPTIQGRTVTDQPQIEAIKHYAQNMRKNIIRMLAAAGSGHPGGALGLADIYAALFFGDDELINQGKSGGILRYDFNNPNDHERDLLVISNGHTVPVYYAMLREAGMISDEEMLTLRKFGSRLQGHPERGTLPWIETTSGPLGEGLSQAAGMAYVIKNFDKDSGGAKQLSASVNSYENFGAPSPVTTGARSVRGKFVSADAGNDRKIFCMLGDGELDEGEIWEAAMFAAKNHLSNITAIIDRNTIQLSGATEDIMPLEPLADKWRSFNWNTIEIDGNDVAQILFALGNISENPALDPTKPTAIIAKTVLGKGVDFMENNYEWHGKVPNAEEAQKALAELSEENS